MHESPLFFTEVYTSCIFDYAIIGWECGWKTNKKLKFFFVWLYACFLLDACCYWLIDFVTHSFVGKLSCMESGLFPMICVFITFPLFLICSL